MENDLTYRTSIEDLAVFRKITNPKEKEDPEALASAQDILSWLDCTSTQFIASYNRIMKIMDKSDICGLRASNNLSECLVSMSVLSWNTASRSRLCDWGLTATAFTLEAAHIPRYRNKLLSDCPGANAIRTDLHALFLSVTKPELGDDGSMVTQWSFADNIKLGETRNPSGISMDTLLTLWEFCYVKPCFMLIYQK